MDLKVTENTETLPAGPSSAPETEKAGAVEAKQAAGPVLDISSTYFDFGSVYLYSTATRTLTFYNNGSRDLTISNLSMTNSSFSYSSGSSFTVPPGEGRTITIRFTPYFSQSYYGSLMFRTNDPQYSSGSVYLTGTGRSYTP